MLIILGNFGDENVVFNKTSLVCSLQLAVIRQSAAHFASNFKVAKGNTRLLEALIVGDNDNCSVEWSIYVASDLRLTIEFVASLIHDDHCNLIRGGFSFWQVVQVKIILSFCITHLHFCIFCFV